MASETRKITVELNLTEQELTGLLIKSGISGKTAGELLTSFVCDLVGSERRNGSDESLYAAGWLERCAFEYRDPSYLGYLLEEGLLESYQTNKDHIAYLEDELSDEGISQSERADLEEELRDFESEQRDFWEQYISEGRKIGACYEEEIQRLQNWMEQASETGTSSGF